MLLIGIFILNMFPAESNLFSALKSVGEYIHCLGHDNIII